MSLSSLSSSSFTSLDGVADVVNNSSDVRISQLPQHEETELLPNQIAPTKLLPEKTNTQQLFEIWRQRERSASEFLEVPTRSQRKFSVDSQAERSRALSTINRFPPVTKRHNEIQKEETKNESKPLKVVPPARSTISETSKPELKNTLQKQPSVPPAILPELFVKMPTTSIIQRSSSVAEMTNHATLPQCSLSLKTSEREVNNCGKVDRSQVQLSGKFFNRRIYYATLSTYNEKEVVLKDMLWWNGSRPTVSSEVCQTIQHKNVLRVLEQKISHNVDYFVTEKGDMSLFDYLHSPKPNLGYGALVNLAREVALGMHHLHTGLETGPIFHGGLKSSNVILFTQPDGSFKAKVTDFWHDVLTMFELENKNNLLGIINYLPREIIIEEKCIDAPVDWYSYGVLIWEMFHRQFPFDGCSFNSIVNQIVNFGMRFISRESCPEAIKHIIARSTLQETPEDRLSFATVLHLLQSPHVVQSVLAPSVRPPEKPSATVIPLMQKAFIVGLESTNRIPQFGASLNR